MLKKMLYTAIERRHFWRYASFNEIAELYAARTIRVIAISIVSGFTSVYLYEQGYDLLFISLFWAVYFALKVLMAMLAGPVAAKFGPKHGILISDLLYVPSMVSLALLPYFGMTSIVVWGIFMAMSTSLHHLCYMIDFSKVKSVEHAGKELAIMNILEKIAVGISPIIGGVIALYFGLGVVMWLAAALFVLAATPLLRTVEPIRTNQKLSLGGFPWRISFSNLVGQLGVGFDYVTTNIIWSMFIVIVIFPGAKWDIYVKLGILSSVTIVTAIVASYIYGKLIDKRKGGDLLKIGVFANAIVHLFRPAASTPAMIVAINIANEGVTMGYAMPFTRGVFDTADISGHRIIYLIISDMVANLGALVANLSIALLILLMGDLDALNWFFVLSAMAVLLIGVAKFQIYEKSNV